ncbi:MBL fold metallo-hydrolase [Clostridium sp.]|uniref:MBL fold metallo-hydrolase n=1 Tax=Clostridium sp. TaxID=1506 RepID=UPI0025865BBF|nr:MBL fold metallo-hydrolase [Clostridium sp.]MDF2504070.1 metal dependent hydrolase [Clostridium sp.]
MNEIITLEVKSNFRNGSNIIYPVILKDEQDMILIDCGYPHFLSLIKTSAKEKGIGIDKLTKIIITHHDFDHMGALAEFKNMYQNVLIISSNIEEKYISGREKPLRLQQAEDLYHSLPEEQKSSAYEFHKLLQSIKPVKVDLLVEDQEIFPWCGGTEIIATPGHMPGHISLYLKESKTLIAGDALVIENDKLGIANPNYTLDMFLAKKSIKKLLDYDIEKVICYHGGIYAGDIKASLEELL